jgi:hypothetical protein
MSLAWKIYVRGLKEPAVFVRAIHEIKYLGLALAKRLASKKQLEKVMNKA